MTTQDPKRQRTATPKGMPSAGIRLQNRLDECPEMDDLWLKRGDETKPRFGNVELEEYARHISPY